MSQIKFRAVSLAAASALAMIGSPAPASAQAQAVSFQSSQVHFNIPAQPLASALTEFSRQSQIPLLVPNRLVNGRRSVAISGDMTPSEALARLSSGSSLRVQQTPEGGLTLIQDQTTSPPQLGANDQPASSEDEIVVTARKRAEDIQRVPMSITALTGEDIDRRGLVGAEDYLRGLPGVNQMTESQGASVVIRGLDTSPSAQNFASGPTVATYFGETPTTNTAGLGGGSNIDVRLVDIARVEVLRGPQGTAFGNSSLGGAVRVIPASPNLQDFEGHVAGNYSETAGNGASNTMVQAVGNIPLIDNMLAVRVVGYAYDDSGFYRNNAADDPGTQAIAATYGAAARAVNQDHVGDNRVRGGRISALLQATNNLQVTLSYLNQQGEVDGQPLANNGPGYSQALLQVAPADTFRGERAGVFDTDLAITNLTATYRLDWADLVATLSDVQSGTTFAQPLGGFAWSVGGVSDHDEQSGEIRIASHLTGPLNFLAGIYAESLKDRYFQDLQWSGDPLTIPFFFGSSPEIGTELDHRKTTQTAYFGEVSWEMLPHLTATLGARNYHFDRTSDTSATGILAGANTSQISAGATGTSYRADLSYEPNDNVLLYGVFSQGFRLGRPQVGLSASTCDTNSDGIVDGTSISVDSTRSVAADHVDNYELGGKFSLLDRRLRVAAAVYRVNWDGVPVTLAGPSLACGFTYVANAGQARSQGVEFQASYRVTDAWRFDAGFSTTDATLTRDVPSLGVSRGARLPGTPEFNANLSVQYDFALGGHDAFIRADAIYVGPFYGNLQQAINTRSGDYWKLDLNGRISFNRINFDVFVHNLTDADDFTFRSVFDQGPFFGYRLRPRTIGAQLSYDF